MAEIVRTGPTDYEYGRTPSQFDVLGLLDAFTPVRRPVVTPSRTEYTEMDGVLYGDTTPAEYGDPEFGFEYMPAYQAVSGLLADPMAAISAIPEAMVGQIEDYATATEGALQGYEGMITPEGEPIEANPLLPMEYLLGGSIGAMRAGENVLGAAGGYPSWKLLMSPEDSFNLGRFISQNTHRNPKKLAKEAREWGLLDGVSNDDFYSEHARIKELKGQRARSAPRLRDTLEAARENRPETAQKNKFKKGIKQSPMFESWTEEKRSLVLNSPDRQMANDAAMLATVDAISREAKKRGLKVYHTSKGRDGKASSRYIETPDGRRVRVSDHALPDTAERQHKRSVGIGVLSDDIVVDDWRITSVDEYLSQILSPDSEVSPGTVLGAAGSDAKSAASLGLLSAAGGRGLKKEDLDPMGYSKIRLDEPLAELDYDLAPASLLMPERKVVSPSDLQNKVILFGAGDRSGVGLLSRIGDTEFDEPVVALGGRDYQLATPYAWASDEGVITGLLNRAKRAQEETGIEDVLLAHSTMNPEAVDFTEMMSSTVAEMLKTAKISKKDAKKFDDDIRQAFEDFPGVKSPKFREWMATVPSGKGRSVIIKKMDNAKRRDEGFPFIGKARYALTEEAQQNVPTFQSGLSFVPIDVEAGAVKDPSIRHATYGTAMERTGDPVQFSGTIPNEDVYRDFFKTLEGAVTKTGAPQPASMKQYTTRLNNPYQVVDQELVDTLSGLLGE